MAKSLDAPAEGVADRKNAGEMTVSELSSAVRSTVEARFDFVRVRGEISGFRGLHASGHAYFSLKDETARLDAVIWRTTVARLRIMPENGLEVIACGKVTTYPGKSSYQIVVQTLEPAGLGALMAQLEARRVKLAAEGLFEAARKRKLPLLPLCIGVVTSASGAVIRDILHRVAERFPMRVVVWPVQVQGQEAAEQVARAIHGFNDLAALGVDPDVIIVARGGGSIEDLWSFNDEAVVRAAAASRKPVVSAIGHETDWTLLDHVADVRAPTPTAAAEICVPVQAELQRGVDATAARMRTHLAHAMERRRFGGRVADQALAAARSRPAALADRVRRLAETQGSLVRNRLSRARTSLGGYERRLGYDSLNRRIGDLRRFVQEIDFALRNRSGQSVARRARTLAALSVALNERKRGVATRSGASLARAEGRRTRAFERLVATLGRSRHRLEAAALASRKSLQQSLAAKARRIEGLAHLLSVVDFRAQLERGFAIVKDESGSLITSRGEAQKHASLTLGFRDGEVRVKTEKRAARGRRDDKSDDAGQFRLI